MKQVKVVETVTYIDPPSGWKYGFPKIIPEGEFIEHFLLENGYPEESLEFAMKWSRVWQEEVEVD